MEQLNVTEKELAEIAKGRVPDSVKTRAKILLAISKGGWKKTRQDGQQAHLLGPFKITFKKGELYPYTLTSDGVVIDHYQSLEKAKQAASKIV